MELEPTIAKLTINASDTGQLSSATEARGRYIHRIVLMSILAVALLVAGRHFYSIYCGTPILPDSALEIPSSALNIGEVWVRDDFTLTLPLRNITDREISIRDLTASCNCTSISPKTLVIAPTATADLQLTIDLTPRSDEFAKLTSFPFSVGIRAMIDNARPQVWEIKGVIRNPFTAVPRRVVFEDPLIKGMPFPPRTFIVPCPPHCSAIVPKAMDDRVMVTSTQNPTCDYVLTLNAAEHLPLGQFKSRILLGAIDAEQKLFASTIVDLTGEVVNDLQVSASQFTFGLLELGEKAGEVISVDSRTGREFHIESARSTIRGVTATPAESNGSHNRVRIECTSSTLGTQNGQLEIGARYDNGDMAYAVVSIFYQGIESK